MKSPFKFLDAFTLQDKDAFFGRDQEIDTLYTLVFKTPLLLVYGLSGTGKTSLVQCGLASRFDGPDWYPIFIRRNENINTSLSTVMNNALGTMSTDKLVDNVSLLLRKTLRPVYLLFDQLEELFILGNEEEQLAFMNSLRDLLDAQLPAKIVLIMREEYIGQLYNYEKLIPELFDHRFRVEPMGPTKVKNVIRSSFDKFNIHLAEPKEELLESMVQNISDPRTGITLPYLQVYLDMLYRDKYRKQYGQGEAEGYPKIDITKKEIGEIGKIDNVLERFLDDQIKELQQDLGKKYKDVKPGIVQTVLDVFVSEEGTKRPIHYKQTGENLMLTDNVAENLQSIPAPMLTEILNSLQKDRILRRSDEFMELAHDSLALVIDSRRSEAQRQLQNVRKRLLNAYEEYQKTGAFLNQRQLASFEEFIPHLGLSKEIEQFLDKCDEEIIRKASEEKDRLHQEAQMQQQKRLARTRKTWLVIASGFAAIAGIMAFQAYTKADKLKIETDKLIIQTAISEEKADSIKTILTKVDAQFGRMDSIVRGELDDNELGITVIKLKSLVKGGSTDVQTASKHYSSVIKMFTTKEVSEKIKESVEEKVFKPSGMVFVALHLKTPLPKEWIQVRWIKDSIEIAEPTFIELASGRDSTAWVSSFTTVKGVGKYAVEVSNSLGVIVGRHDFEVQGVSTSEASLVSDDKFFTSDSYDKENKRAGKRTTNFKVNQTIYYVGNINSPKDADVVYVKLIDDSGKVIWNFDHDIARNTSESGYRIWNGKSVKTAGKYYIKLENSQGEQIAGFEITVEQISNRH
jgi:hypothetical protein